MGHAVWQGNVIAMKVGQENHAITVSKNQAVSMATAIYLLNVIVKLDGRAKIVMKV